MATVTGLTAARMQAIEAASVVDGDVVGDNLILTTKGGTQINAGSVRGPKGDVGPVGQDLSVVSARSILDVGLANQIRAGRQLTLQDFTNLGLNPPAGLWNLSDLTDASGNARALINKGAIPFVPGINGVANTAAQFVGSTAQVLYISDVGANDPFRIKTGSWGCWFRSVKRGAGQSFISKRNPSSNYSYDLFTSSNNVLTGFISLDGSAYTMISGFTDVVDDKWHFGVVTFDGSLGRLYVDGIVEASVNVTGTLFGSPGPLNIGGEGGDASSAPAQPVFGRIDEAFVTADILTEDQIRNLYCVKIPHTLPVTPSRISLNVRRRRKGASLVSADFPTQPLRLHNFSAGSLGDEGSNNVPLVAQNAPVTVAGADGTASNAYNFNGTNNQLASTDTGLPSGVVAQSYGCWFKSSTTGLNLGIIGFGGGSAYSMLWISGGGLLQARRTPDDLNTNVFVCDGNWHFVVEVDDNAAADGNKRKVYLDGRLVGVLTNLVATVLGGANSFGVGAFVGLYHKGQVDAAFVCGYALTNDQILALYAKGSQSLGISPKNSGDHIEAIRATDLLATFDTLESQHQIDLAVA